MVQSGISFEGFGRTDTGRRRENNEDAILVDNELGFYAVCDGMGGHSSGEIASRTCVEALGDCISRHTDRLSELRAGGRDSGAIEFIESILYEVSSKVHDLAQTHPEYAGMGTTATIVLMLEQRAVMGHIGDSRLYMVRDENMYILSDDHTFANEMVQRGILSPEEAERSPRQHMLTRAIGHQPAVPVDTLLFDLFPGDQLILCSDGLSVYLGDAEEVDNIIDPANAKRTVDGLINFANASGGQDNVSVIAVNIASECAESPAATERSQEVANYVSMLSCAPPFTELPFHNLLHLARIAKLAEIPAGEVLIEEGRHCDGYYLLLKGKVSVSRKGKAAEYAREAFGLECMVDNLRALVTVTALETCHVLYLNALQLEQLFKRYPRLGQRALKKIAFRFAGMITR